MRYTNVAAAACFKVLFIILKKTEESMKNLVKLGFEPNTSKIQDF